MSILLAQSDENGGQVSVAEFENMFWLFAVAGNETLRNGLPGACIALIEHPQAQRELRADPALMPWATVRDAALVDAGHDLPPYRCNRLRDRRAAHPCRRQGGGLLHLGQPRRRVFKDPGRFDIRRQPNPHLVFGHGPHFCLGAHLARTQMSALFTEVLARTSALDYAGPPSYLRSNFQRGVKRLPVAWTA